MRRIVALIARGPASSLSALGRLRDVRYPRANTPSAAALSSFVDLRRFPLGSDFTALNLATADRIADGVVLEAERRKFQPVSVVVCDPAGRVIVSKRMDGCANLIPASAEAKAVSSVAMNRSSRSLRDGCALQSSIRESTFIIYIIYLISLSVATNGRTNQSTSLQTRTDRRS